MKILTLAALSVLLTGCGQAGVLAKGDYWREFFGPGNPGETIEASSLDRQPGAAGVQNLDAALRDSIDAMKESYAKANSFIRSFPAAEDRYHGATERLRKTIQPDGKPLAKPVTEIDRKKFASAFSQATALLDVQRERIQSAKADFDQLTVPALKRAGELEKSCTTPVAGQTVQACAQFLNALSLFRVKLEVTSTGFAHLNDVYEVERRAEDDLARQTGQQATTR